jgi:hypothetical protein
VSLVLKLSNVMKHLPKRVTGIFVLVLSLLISIFIFRYFIPFSSEVASVPLVDSNLAVSIPFKLVVGICLIAVPLIFYLLAMGKYFSNLRKALFLITPEAFVATLFLGHLIFQAKFSSTYGLAIKFLVLSSLFLVISSFILGHFAFLLERKFLNFLIRIYVLLALASILYINFHAYNQFLAHNYLYILGFLLVFNIASFILGQFRAIPESYTELFYRIPFWMLLLFPARSNLVNLHPFESYAYSNLELFRKGFRPWRDLGLEHGIWEDLGRNWLGSMVAGPSFWGQVSGILGIVNVLEYFALALLFFAISRNAYVSIGTVLFLQYFSSHILNVSIPRMIPILFVTVLLRQYLQKNSKSTLIVLGFTMGLAILWSFESLFGVVAAGLVIAFTSLKSGLNFRKVTLTLSISVILTVSTPLLLFGILDDFILSFKEDTSGYLVAWASNISLTNGPLFNLLLFSVPICVMIFNYSIFDELFSKKNSNKSILWVAPSLISVMVYYVKFLAWPDWHLAQSSSVLILLLSLYAMSLISNYSTKFKDRFLVAILVFSFMNFVGISPGNATAIRYSEANFDESTRLYVNRITEVKNSFLPYLPKGERSEIFDFGNEPVTWFGILGFSSNGGDTHVFTTFSKSAQLRTLERLENSRPDAVIWGGEFGYFNWPAPGNSLRSYLISSYILKNYYPVVTDGGYTLMLPGPGLKDNLSLKAISNKTSCDWGDGNSRFIHPISNQKILESFDTGPNEAFPLSTKAMSLTIESDVQGKFSLLSSAGFGEILFTLESGLNRVWLDSCPAWHYGKDGAWKIVGPDGNFFVSSKG